MADLSDRVAIIALVIFLIALLITSIQLLQAFAGTAEGFRRCAASVIGPWSKLRWRRPNFAELRVEVIYQTPHFAIRNPASVPTEQAVCSLATKVQESAHESLFDIAMRETLLPPAGRRVKPTCRLLRPKHNGSADGGLAEKGGQSTITRVQTAQERQESIVPPQSEVKVSWLQFAQEIHDVYHVYWIATDGGSNGYASGRTDALVSPREWNWDFMPVDLLRPMATTTLGEIILLGMRLGMTWRTLDLERGFAADGNGRTSSSVDMRGLGLVFKLANDTSTERLGRKVVPSKAADQLMFGIIPGDRTLVGADRSFLLVSADRKIRGYPPKEVLQAIGVNEPEVLRWAADKKWQEPHNELVHLICPFMSLKGCRYPWRYYPGWTNANVVRSPFHFYEGRMAFLDELERLVQRGSHPQLATLRSVLAEFHALRSDWTDDFLDHWGYTALEDGDDERRLSLVDACRDVHDMTTRYFCGNSLPISHTTHVGEVPRKVIPGQHDWRASSNAGTQYIDLVAAHYIVVSAAAHHGAEKLDYPEILRNPASGVGAVCLSERGRPPAISVGATVCQVVP